MKLAIIFIHLLATCMVLGIIMVADFRFLRMVSNYKLVLPAPSKFEQHMVASCLIVLWITGLTLIILGLMDKPDYLMNQKLQAKIALVSLITLNAGVLHLGVFPFLAKQIPIYKWKTSKLGLICCSIGLSNSMWMFCAFLGIARSWNFNMPREYVWAIAFVLWVSLAISIQFMLMIAARNRPVHRMDWIDKLKHSFRVINEERHDDEDSVLPIHHMAAPRRQHVSQEVEDSVVSGSGKSVSELQGAVQNKKSPELQHA